MNHYNLMSDKDLVCLFQDGEEQAFAELLNRHKDRIYSTIFYLVRETELAEDLFQDAFMRIITKLREKHYNEEGKFIAWAVTLTRNLVMDYFRVNKHMFMVRGNDDYSPFDVMPEGNRNALEQIIHNEKVEKVRRMIDRLSPNQKEVVILRHYAGLSFKEIASTLNININTALGRMHFAVIEMKAMVQSEKTGIKPEKRKAGRKKKERSVVTAEEIAGKEEVNTPET